MPESSAFLDTSALFAAVLSSIGGARALLKLGELGVVSLWVGPLVLQEAEEVFRRRAPDLLPLVAGLLASANVQVGPAPGQEDLARAAAVVSYAPDARVLAEAFSSGAEYFATHDRAHFLDNPQAGTLPCRIGSPCDVFTWLRSHLSPDGSAM
jgi:predicted nucleic acid-binding protein